MDRPYVKRLRALNFGCARDVSVRLTPLHAFVGPNDSGKSTLLRALQSAALGSVPPHATGEVVITAQCGEWAWTRSWARAGARTAVHAAVKDAQEALATDSANPSLDSAPSELRLALRGVRLLRLDPDAMRKPTGLITKSAPIEFDERGGGLAGVYDALLSRKRTAFDTIERRLRELFPSVQGLELSNPTSTEKAIGVRLDTGEEVSAYAMSEGMLYWLAFAALPYLSETAICIIEEPENGLHPARIREVMMVLRAVAETTQVLMATHSPLVINELQPDEVTIITRTRERGTIATPMTETKNFAKRSKVYALGELWLSYADGDLESNLVGDTDATAAAGER